jgi:hypothetical protein
MSWLYVARAAFLFLLVSVTCCLGWLASVHDR